MNFKEYLNIVNENQHTWSDIVSLIAKEIGSAYDGGYADGYWIDTSKPGSLKDLKKATTKILKKVKTVDDSGFDEIMIQTSPDSGEFVEITNTKKISTTTI